MSFSLKFSKYELRLGSESRLSATFSSLQESSGKFETRSVLPFKIVFQTNVDNWQIELTEFVGLLELPSGARETNPLQMTSSDFSESYGRLCFELTRLFVVLHWLWHRKVYNRIDSKRVTKELYGNIESILLKVPLECGSAPKIQSFLPSIMLEASRVAFADKSFREQY